MSSDLSTITQALVDLLTTNKETLGIQGVCFGDIALVPRVPFVAVVPQGVDHVPSASFMLATDEIEVHLFVYHGRLQDVRTNLKQALQYAEAVRDQITIDKTLGGNVLFSWVMSMDLGVGRVGDELMATTRMVWRGRARTQF